MKPHIYWLQHLECRHKTEFKVIPVYVFYCSLLVNVFYKPKIASLKGNKSIIYLFLNLRGLWNNVVTLTELIMKYNTLNKIITEFCYLEFIYMQESIPHWINFHSHKKSRASRSWVADLQRVLSTFQQTQLAVVLCIARLKERTQEEKSKTKTFLALVFSINNVVHTMSLLLFRIAKMVIYYLHKTFQWKKINSLIHPYICS